MSEQKYPPIDWSDLENIEPIPGGEWKDYKIVARYQHACDSYPHLLVLEDKQGRCGTETVTDDGRIYHDEEPAFRNKLKTVHVPDYWVAYWPKVDPSNCQVTVTDFESIALDWEQQGALVEHHPGHDKAV